MSTRRHHRNADRPRLVTALLAASAVVTLAGAARAQQQAPQEQPFEPYLAVVTTDQAFVRSGASDAYYPFGQARRGDVVQVIGEKFKWARVGTTGPAFDDMFGYIKYPSSETGRFHVSPDGKTGLTLGRTDVLAPNLNTNFNPKDSWKPIARLEADQMIVVIETLRTDRETVHRIALPDDAIAWVVQSSLSPATPSQVAAWESAMAGIEKAKPVVERPAVEPPVVARRDAPRDPAPPPVLGRDEPAVRPVPTDGAGAARVVEPQRPAVAAVTDPLPDVLVEETVIADPLPQASPRRPTTPPAVDGRPESAARAELEALEAEYQRLLEDAADETELLALRQQYLNLADRKPPVKRVSAFAAARARQLKIWNELQSRRGNLTSLRTQVRDTATDAGTQIQALESRVPYTAIGRLSVSTVYDGSSLPRLFRLQDAGTGRTIAYLKADGRASELVPMLGQLIGIVGEKSFDDGLRLNMIAPRRIDLLTARDQPAGATQGG